MIPIIVPIAELFNIVLAQPRNSLKDGNTPDSLKSTCAVFIIDSVVRIASDTANNPIKTGMNETPFNKSTKPKVNRG